MLDFIRRNSRSVMVYVLFGFLVAAFVLTLTPGRSSRGCLPKGLGAGTAAYVRGNEISAQEVNFWTSWFGQYIGSPRAEKPEEQTKWASDVVAVRKIVVEALIRRELLIIEGKQWGLTVSEDEANKRIQLGELWFNGEAMSVLKKKVAPEGRFDYKKLEDIVSWRGFTVADFVESQRRELLADKVRKWIRLNVRASDQEVRQAYEDEMVRFNLQYVLFTPAAVPAAVLEPSEKQKAAFVASHKEALEKAFEQKKKSYETAGPWVRWSRMLVEWRPAAVSEKEKPEEAAKKQQEADAKKAAAEAKIQTALARFRKGERFEKLAAEISDDNVSKKRGGLKGWQPKAQLSLDDKAWSQVAAARPGEVVGPFLTPEGYELIQVLALAEGPLTLEHVREELALDLFREEQTAEWVRSKAQALADALQQGKNMIDLYPTEAEKGSLLRTQETGLTQRKGGSLPGIGQWPDLVRFALSAKSGQWLGPKERNAEWIVVRLKERTDFDPKGLESARAETRARLESAKAAVVVDRWVQQQCLDAKAVGKIKVYPVAIGGDGENGQDPQLAMLSAVAQQTKFEPCSDSPPMPSWGGGGMPISVRTADE